MTTYSTSLKLSLIGDGEQSGTWGQTTNTNLGTLLEQAITGVVNITMTDANYTLTDFNGVSDEARNAVLIVGGTNTGIKDVIAPAVEKLYAIKNATVGGYAIRIKTSSGIAVTVPNGVTTCVYCDGTDFYEQQTGTAGNFSIGGNATVGGTLNVTGATTLSTALPVTSGGTGATTASGARTGLGLGTISTQDANNVSITGGSITGITDLAIADGGTGASTANSALNNLLPTQTSANGKYLKSNGTDSSWDAIDISTSDVTGTLAVANGGTGASDAGTARTNLGLGTISVQDANSVNISGGTITGSYGLTATNVSGTVAVANGGTGATDAGTARTNLGLGTISTQAANNVNITGGSITGITDLAIADGGTGASTAAGAFTNLKQAATDTATGVVELATSAEASAGTDTTRAITPATLRNGFNATGSASVYAARAWVCFNGNVSPTATIRGSGNVSSVSYDSSGSYTVNFTTAMPDANYAVAATGNPTANSGNNYYVGFYEYTSPARSTSKVSVGTGASPLTNPTYASVIIFR